MADIYVNMLSSSSIEDGTQQHPWKTIQDGIDAANAGDTVRVMDNAYFENVTLSRGVNLEPWTGIPKIAGQWKYPTIHAKGENKIRGFMIRGGTAGIKLDLEEVLGSTKYKTKSLIADCEIHETHRGIEVTTPNNSNFASGKRKSAYITLRHNWIHHSSGDGITFNLIGPTKGELQISAQIEDNVIQNMFAGISLTAKGQGPNPRGFVRALYAGWIFNNLIFNGQNGIRLESENLGDASVTISNNTIANSVRDGIIARAITGTDGDASTHPSVINNIIVDNKQAGYMAFDEKTYAVELTHNLFHQNKVNYFEGATNSVLMSQSELNTPIINGRDVMFGSGSDNLVADPLFVDGVFPWMGSTNTSGPHAFFLRQNKRQKSPAVDSGRGTSQDMGLDKYTTRIDFKFDMLVVDRGFHYLGIES